MQQVSWAVLHVLQGARGLPYDLVVLMSAESSLSRAQVLVAVSLQQKSGDAANGPSTQLERDAVGCGAGIGPQPSQI